MLSIKKNYKGNLIHYYIHGRGRGHATRAQAIIEALLKEQYEVIAFAGEDAFPMLLDRCDCRRIYSIMPSLDLQQIKKILSRTHEAIHHIKSDDATLILSDGDLPAILAANWTRRPSIAIGHSEVFGRCARPKGLPILPWWKERTVARLSAPTASAYVAVNFAPIITRHDNVIVARPELRSDIPEKATVGKKILCYFRDENGDEILRTLLKLEQAPILFTKQPENKRKGVVVSALGSKAFGEALIEAKAVVASAGSQLMSECVALQIPVFALYKKNDAEQRLNVEMLRGYGMGDGCSFSEFSAEKMNTFLEQTKDQKNKPKPRWDAPQVSAAIVSTVKSFLR